MQKVDKPILRVNKLAQLTDEQLKETAENMILIWEESERRKAERDKQKFEKFCEEIRRRK